jgi:hypothetical protein
LVIFAAAARAAAVLAAAAFRAAAFAAASLAAASACRACSIARSFALSFSADCARASAFARLRCSCSARWRSRLGAASGCGGFFVAGAAGFGGAGISVGSITSCVSARVLSRPIDRQSTAVSTAPQILAPLDRHPC